MNSIITLLSLIRFGVPKIEITGNQKAIMQYVDYKEDIVWCYGIVLERWTFNRFVNPSELSTALPPLQKLLDALNDGSCKFIRLTQEQCQAHEKKYRTKLASGEIQVHQRKTRKDAGKKQKWNPSTKKVSSGNNSDNDDGSTMESDNLDDSTKLKKCCRSAKSAPIVDSSADEDSST